MIPLEILSKLVPNRFPEDDVPAEFRFASRSFESAMRWIGVWGEYLRLRLRLNAEEGYLAEMFQRTGLIGTGIFRVAGGYDSEASSEFPIVDGYQFGTVFFQAARFGALADRSVVLERGQSRVPLLETVAIFNPHASTTPDGYVAAVFEDDRGNQCGITAGHVVSRYQQGQLVPIECSECGHQGRLVSRAPGFIDAAVIKFSCGGPSPAVWRHPAPVRSAIEGETVHLHFGNTGIQASTVMMSLSSPSEIMSAAMPKHFLTDEHGYFGDSGSLISTPHDDHEAAELIGIYLGDTNCRDPNGFFVNYGYALDLKQAAAVLGARDLKGDFND